MTSGENTTYGGSPALEPSKGGGTCCTPETPQGVCYPPKPELADNAARCGSS